MVLSRGGKFFDETGAPIFQNGTAALDSFTMLADGVDDGYFDQAGVALDDYETLIEFGTGKTAFLLDSTWAATQANRNADLSKVTDKVGYILVPGAVMFAARLSVCWWSGCPQYFQSTKRKPSNSSPT